MIGDTLTFGDKPKTLAYDANAPRNTVDHLRWWREEDIQEYVEANKFNYSLMLVNLANDNNIGNIIRSSNIFGAKEVIIYGHRRFNRNSTVGAEFYQKFRHIKFVEDVTPLFASYDEVIALDNNLPNAINMKNHQWDKDKNILIVIGQENGGVPEDILVQCNKTVYIEQFGTVRSLNVSVAAGIMMHDYVNRIR